MLTAPLVDIVNGTSFIAMRSIISKLVPPDELGKFYREEGFFFFKFLYRPYCLIGVAVIIVFQGK